MAEHKEFFDVLYQQWSLTTGAKDTYWMVEEDTEHFAFGPGNWIVWAFNPNTEDKTFIGAFDNEVDADFVAGLNGAVPDLIRHLGTALDENDRLDEARDAAENLAADNALENQGLREQIRELEERLEEEGQR
ncbi:hypothetical protein SEA_SORORFAGO_44 [Mycobacterium phage SororFago]|nr:hypothetical protein SEA_SORORFAGO_44 [Mycobacterium phage SororFago]